MKQSAVIFDMDGTLADVSGIRHFVRTRPKDFDAFHRESVNCPPHDWVVDLARTLSQDHAIIIVTARRALWRHHTAWWLAVHGVPSDALFMRASKDSRKDYLVKRDILAQIQQSFRVVHAVDDNPAVLALWAEHGIPTTVVPGWES